MSCIGKSKLVKLKHMILCAGLMSLYFSLIFVVMIVNEWKITKRTNDNDIEDASLRTSTTKGEVMKQGTATAVAMTTKEEVSTTNWQTTTAVTATKSPSTTASAAATTQPPTTTATTETTTKSPTTTEATTKSQTTTVSTATTTKSQTTTAATTKSQTSTVTTAATTKSQTSTVTTAATTKSQTSTVTTAATTKSQTSTVTTAATRKSSTTTVTKEVTTKPPTTTATTVTTTKPPTTTAVETTTEPAATTTVAFTSTPQQPWNMKFYGLGCYFSLPELSDFNHLVVNLRNYIDWSNMTKTIVACADFIKKPETIRRYGQLLKFFAIKFYGECWAETENVSFSYYSRGTFDSCYKKTGAENSVYVYHFGPSERPPQKKVVSVGCYADGASLPIKHLIGNFTISGASSESDGTRVASDCYKLVWERGYSLFGLKNKGECWSGPDAHMTYNKDGVATDCVHGLGSANSFSVYRLE
ncbi:uncharacterized protein LOC135689983 [Rhopilema esculentum]|uniref:uncharacterized protein LOC135689983 n=1 Tax=Rhopilema esculentum TaxID=499914 RepID=UPI0031D4CDB3